MRHYTVRSLWKNVTSSWSHEASSNPSPPEANTIADGISTQSSGQSSNDFTMNMVSVVPTQPSRSPDGQVSDKDKAGATLLFSGVFLSLVGMTFTVMGWISSDVSNNGGGSGGIEWTQLLGPILLSVGGTFVIISLCKFSGFQACQTCMIQNEESGEEIDLPPLSGPSFVFSSLNQPITFHRATVVHYIPPPYTSVMQDLGRAQMNTFQSNQLPVAVAVSTPPQYYSIYPTDNTDLSNDGEMQEYATESRETRYSASVMCECEVLKGE